MIKDVNYFLPLVKGDFLVSHVKCRHRQLDDIGLLIRQLHQVLSILVKSAFKVGLLLCLAALGWHRLSMHHLFL
jgi:hypothetical protein